MSANCFEEDLRWSEAQHAQDWWLPYYQKAFPRHKSINTITGPCAAQKAGIDKMVTLEGGKQIAVDEKIRRNRPPTDILIEFEHKYNNGISWPGWITKPNQFTDYIAFGFQKYRVAFFLPFIPLQNAWLSHAEEWKKRFPVVSAPNRKDNPRYHTWSCCVPTEILLGHMLGAMRIQL